MAGSSLAPKGAPPGYVRDVKRNEAWRLHLEGWQPERIAEYLSGEGDEVTEKTVQRWLDSTYTVQRGRLQRDTAEARLRYVARLEGIHETTWNELRTQQDQREKLLAGEYTRSVNTVGKDGKLVLASETPNLQFQIPALIKELHVVAEKIAKAEGVTTDKQTIEVTHTQITAKLEALEADEDPSRRAAAVLLRRTLERTLLLGPGGRPDVAGLPDGENVVEGEFRPAP